MYYGHNTGEDIKKFAGLPHSALIITLLVIGLLFLFMNGIIHNGSRPLEYIYRFLFYSALFTFIYSLLLSFHIIHKDFVTIGILIIGVLFSISYFVSYSTTHLEGNYYLQNGIVKYNIGDNYYTVEGLNNNNYTILGEHFIKDDTAIYYDCTRIKDLDFNSFEIVLLDNEQTIYIKDKKNVFYGDVKLENADPSTFEATEPVAEFYAAKDKNYIYSEEKCYLKKDENNTDSTYQIPEYVKTKEEIKEENEEKDKLVIQNNLIYKSTVIDNKDIVDYITDIPLQKINIKEASDEIEDLKEEGFFTSSIDKHPEKLYRLYQIYLNNDNTKAFDYLKRASISFKKNNQQDNISFLARYDYAYRLLVGNGIKKDIKQSLLLLVELKEIFEEIYSYDGLSNSANNEKYALTLNIDFATKPITAMNIYHESCYLLAKIFSQGKLVPQNLILAEKFARPLTHIFYYDQDWTVEKKIKVRRYFLLYIDIVQNTEYKGDTDHSSDLYEMLTKMGFPVGYYKEAMYYYNKKEEIEIPEDGYTKFDLAATYFAYACNDGYGEACYMAGKIYEDEKLYKKGDNNKYGNPEKDPFLIAFLYYEAGAKLGDSKCKYKMGEYYLKGKWYKDEIMMPANKELATKWLKEASLEGITEATQLLK